MSSSFFALNPHTTWTFVRLAAVIESEMETVRQYARSCTSAT
jgi:hypothetical protein